MDKIMDALFSWLNQNVENIFAFLQLAGIIYIVITILGVLVFIILTVVVLKQQRSIRHNMMTMMKKNKDLWDD